MGKPRNSSKAKYELYEWRVFAQLDQGELANKLGLTHSQVSKYETGKLSLDTKGTLIILWAQACGLDPYGPQVQRFLYQTGNALHLPDPECPICQDHFFNPLRFHEQHTNRTLSPETSRAVEEDLHEFRSRKIPPHPYMHLYPARREEWTTNGTDVTARNHRERR